jgi:septum formation protein
MNFYKISTKSYKIILATSSETRIQYFKTICSNFSSEKHLINEDDFKKEKLSPGLLAAKLAKLKSLSLKKKYPMDMIIGSDQVLVCGNKIMSKPKSMEEAKQNLVFLKNKIHTLYSSIHVIKKSVFFFEQVKAAEIYFKDIPNRILDNYVKNNKATVLSTVGSYKIEDNNKFNFIEVKSGDKETILGFPLEDFLKELSRNE